ncbi:MAG: class I SAM-dependent methyltransferase [Candidatus Omnitrophica bacterium]|nr:class I SAM-dependent methyltransferase [Candidatus Omnitrophota bacterium]MCM8770474.1 class I SAM-dependent methyltransferase [Candidatus Omnitrophota bacterium]
MVKEITSEVYDSHIIEQGLQFQIDKYYEPKELPLKRRIKIILDAIAPKASEKILDIGCGVGTFAFHCARCGTNSVGIDYSLESIKVARQLSEKYGTSKNTKFIVGNANRLPFKDSYFDKVVAIDFIEHITFEDKEKLLREICRVLNLKGIAVIFTPNGIRERIGEIYWKIRSRITQEDIPTTDLHYGLVKRSEFESLLRKFNFSFEFKYADITRPYLSKIPILRNFLALELLWIIKK